MELAHHAVNDIDEIDIDDALRVALEAVKNARHKVDFIDCF